MHTTRTVNMRGADTPAEVRGVDGGRHDDYAQIGTYHVLGLHCKREGCVRGETPLMKLVEDNRRHAVECRIGNKQPFQYSLSYDLYTRPRRHTRLETDPESHSLSACLAEHRGHAFRHLPGGKPSRFKHQDLAFANALEHRKRQQCGLAGARRRGDHQTRVRQQRLIYLPGNRRHRQPAILFTDFHPDPLYFRTGIQPVNKYLFLQKY